MSMSLDEALEEGVEVTRAEARAEIARHSLDFAEFMEEHGSHEVYQARDVMIWLGY